ncbi:MAG: DUF2752 domain-containing protein [Propionibacteriaceae bacterium]|jgi:hypothetical protein|nr:DUF2752 domain-containing protein [Propionibacteriaceae bacterium]
MSHPPSWVKPALAGVAGVAVMLLVGFVDPNQRGFYPTCPSLLLTGTYCPGCGSLRALHALAHLDFAGALGMNPALLLAIPYLLWVWTFWLLRTLGKAQRKRLAPAWTLWALLGAILTYWALRNVPALAPWLAPGGVVAPAFQ